MFPLCKTVNNLLGYTSTGDVRSNFLRQNVLSSDSPGLLLLASGDHYTESQPPPAYVVESRSQVYSKPPPGALDRVHGGAGLYRLHDLDYGELGLFTESLGCESSEGAMSREEEAAAAAAADEDIGSRVWRRHQARRREDESRKRRSFPPPLRWLAEGSWSRFMRAEREDGRVRLTEMQIERREILRASREGGRLRLDLVVVGNPDEETEMEEEEEEEDDQEMQAVGEEEEAVESECRPTCSSVGPALRDD